MNPQTQPNIMTHTAKAKRIIRESYGLNRDITDDELRAEIANLRRKSAKGNLDDQQERMLGQLLAIDGQVMAAIAKAKGQP